MSNLMNAKIANLTAVRPTAKITDTLASRTAAAVARSKAQSRLQVARSL
jgi:hypothetical protein